MGVVEVGIPVKWRGGGPMKAGMTIKTSAKSHINNWRITIEGKREDEGLWGRIEDKK